MKVLFWNIRGMGKKSRMGLLKDIIYKEIVDIVGIQETIRRDFADWELLALTPGSSFQWKWLPAKGHSGDILVGVKNDIFEVEEWTLGEFFVRTVLRNRLDNFRWSLVVVYGPAQHDLSTAFLLELSEVLQNSPFPGLIGGISI